MASDRPRAGYLSRLLSRVNARVEPLARSGFGSPGLFPAGLIVLETIGRRTGRTYRTPLFASEAAGGYLWVNTVLGRRANWLRNARANPKVRYWMRGRPRDGRAIVSAPGYSSPELDELPESLRWLAKRGIAVSRALGFGVLIIVPSAGEPRNRRAKARANSGTT